nr:hypothetical protein [Sphingobacterium bovistauri]
MKRINSRGLAQANKHVLMAALCYNLKKYLKFSRKNPQILAQSMTVKKGQLLFYQNVLINMQISQFKRFKFLQ